MAQGPSVCASCGFENPDTWRHCARCGVLLDAVIASVGTSRTLRSSINGIHDLLLEQAEAADSLPPSAPVAVSELDAPLIGQREAALKLQGTLEAAFTVGSSAVGFIHGPDGSGKTRLLTYSSEIAAQVQPNLRVVYVTCRDSDGAYAPFSRMLLDRFGVTPSSSPSAVRAQILSLAKGAVGSIEGVSATEVAHLLGHVAGVPFPDSLVLSHLSDTPDELQKRIESALRLFVQADVERRPLLLLLDNMHIAQSEGWGLFSSLTSVDGHFVLLAAGSSEIKERAIQLAERSSSFVLPVAPLDDVEIHTMLHLLVPHLEEVSDTFVQALAHRSRGNPGALRELVLGLMDAGVFVDTRNGGFSVDVARLEDGDLPVTIEDAIAGRLARLPTTERLTLELASVYGELFWDGGLLAMIRSEQPEGDPSGPPKELWPDTGDEAMLAKALESLEHKGFIESSPHSELLGVREYRFSHSAARQQLYQGQAEPLRIQRHAIAARWLAVVAQLRREGVAAMIAPHLERAGLSARAGRAYLEAAIYERSKMRTTMALRYIERSLPLIHKDDVAKMIDALHEQGSLLTIVGRYEDALVAFGQMAKVAWTLGARGKGGAALNRLARVYRQRGEDAKAEQLLNRALELFREAYDIRGIASTLDDLAQVFRVHGRVDDAMRAANESLQLRQSAGDTRGEAVSLTTLGLVSLARGDLDAAETYLLRANHLRNTVPDHEGTLQAHNALGIIAYERGNVGSAIASWRSALEHARGLSDRRNQCFLLNNIGEALTHEGDFAGAKRAIDEAFVLAEQSSDRRAIVELTRNRAILLLNDDHVAALKLLRTALELAHQYGDPESIARSDRAIADALSERLFGASEDVPQEAENRFQSAIRAFADLGNGREVVRTRIRYARHLIERGRGDEARAELLLAQGHNAVGQKESRAITDLLGATV